MSDNDEAESSADYNIYPINAIKYWFFWKIVKYVNYE